MPLPKITAPTYELEIPSSGQKIKYRPFLVKEEKLLLLAMESKDETQMIDAIKTILRNCIQTPRFKIENLAIFDIEYLFLNIRGKSVGEEIELTVTCPDDGVTTVDVTIDITEIKVEKSKNHSNIVKITPDLTIVMKYPDIDMFVKSSMKEEGDNPVNQEDDDLAASCIHQIISGEDVYEAKNFTKKEISEFLGGMVPEQYEKIQEFFNTMPKLKHVIEVTNPETKVKHQIPIEGLSSFFD